MDILEFIQKKVGNAEVFLDIQDYLETKPPEKILTFCCLNNVKIDLRSGRWIMPFASIEKVRA